MTVTPLGRDQDCSLKIREPDVPASWFLDPGGWSKTATVSLYFIFPGICTLSLAPRSTSALGLGYGAQNHTASVWKMPKLSIYKPEVLVSVDSDSHSVLTVTEEHPAIAISIKLSS
ncbi:hypothetical protein STEG23_028476 [Scotinomys teguina]